MELASLRRATMTPSTHSAWVSHVPVYHEKSYEQYETPKSRMHLPMSKGQNERRFNKSRTHDCIIL